MNESEFVKLWASEKPLYEAWGDYVVKAVIVDVKIQSS